MALVRRIKQVRKRRTAHHWGRRSGAGTAKLGWHHPPFEIPKEIYHARNAREKAKKAQQRWNEKFAAYKGSSATGRRVYPSDERRFARTGRNDSEIYQ
ncbi:hypothetical protein DMI70_13975 [Escherichia coli]|nr:hypothetical protein [Escherichia coli]